MARDLMPVTTAEHGLATVYARVLNLRQITGELRRARRALKGARMIAARMGMGDAEYKVASVCEARQRVRTWVAAAELKMGVRA